MDIIPGYTPNPSVQPLIPTRKLSRGTLVARDLAVSRRFYELFLGLECVEFLPGRLLIRAGTDWVLDVTQRTKIENPQGVLNHWGMDLTSDDEVRAAHSAASKCRDDFGIKKIMNPKFQHGSYSFYLEDVDSNWWEFQHRSTSPAMLKSRGDIA